MSDTTTITPEERARLREQADKSYLLPLDEDEVPSVGFDGLTDDRIAYIAAACNSVPRLLTALEAAEARKEEADSSLARAYIKIGEMSAGIEKIAAANHALAEKVQAAEAENVKLQKMVDWLAENAADRPCAYDSCPFGLQRPTGPDDDDCDKTHAQCWLEAARRAVAAGEGE